MSEPLGIPAADGPPTSDITAEVSSPVFPVTASVAQKARILVVDDDDRNLMALNLILEDLGEELVFARSGEEALRYLLHNDCALILMDVLMPVMDGYETAGLIRSRERSRHIPIIFLTAVSKDEMHEFKGYTAGAVDYVFKPIEPFILRSKVAVFVDLYKKTQEISRNAEQERLLLQENFRANTERLLAERALQRAEERQAIILRSLPIALYSVEAEQPLASAMRISDSITGMCGFSPARFLEERGFWSQRIHPADLPQVQTAFDKLVQTGSSYSEFRWLCEDGTYRSFLNQAVYVAPADGGTGEIVGSWLDITERRTMEQQLIHSQKMESMGRLTGGIAHDFNNMLTVVISSLDRMRRATDADQPARRNIDLALSGAMRCADLTKRLLSFARQQMLEPKALDLNHLLNGSEVIIRRLAGDAIFLDITRDMALWPTYADHTQMESALINLVVNARDAMPDGGRLIIATQNLSLRAGALPNIPAGDYVSLSVHDTGIGIPAEHLDKVFEPFFTAKAEGKGTGLGLSIIYGFVRQSGGHIRLESEVGKGTQVQILLPRHSGVVGAVVSETPDADLPQARPGEVVLVTEDDPQVRTVVATFLNDLGYTTLQAENGDAAVNILRGTDKIDLLFSDIAMPGSLNGYQLAVQAGTLRPGLKVVLTSAYANGVTKGAENRSTFEFLQKPYRNQDLASLVRRTLDTLAAK